MYYPQHRVLNTAEVACKCFHNLYTLRGAQIRDGSLWSSYINHCLVAYAPKADIVIAQHHWPTWGKERITEFLSKQRDVYKFTHDQTLRLANLGHTPLEIAEVLRLPKGLSTEFSVRDYYGTLAHNAKATYQRYLGWYDGNPANLNPLPPTENAKKAIEYMGGAAAVLEKAKKDFENGEYRWVATVGIWGYQDAAFVLLLTRILTWLPKPNRLQTKSSSQTLPTPKPASSAPTPWNNSPTSPNPAPGATSTSKAPLNSATP